MLGKNHLSDTSNSKPSWLSQIQDSEKRKHKFKDMHYYEKLNYKLARLATCQVHVYTFPRGVGTNIM